MIGRLLAATLLVFATTSVAPAQRQWERLPRAPFPAEKFSTRPVQGNPPSNSDPAAPQKTQQQRWEERSRDPSVQPR